MFYAKSIYLGGVIIGANEADYDDYKKLGLRCLNCGEEVFLKKGDNKSPHFAHFKSDNRNKENRKLCILRSSSYSLHSWRELTPEGKKQRKILFQQFFIDIISNTYHDFTGNNLRNKNEATYKNLFDEYSKDFNERKKELISELNALPDDVFANRNEIELQKRILAEVIDYLTLPYTIPILLKVISYILDKKHHDKQENIQTKETIYDILLFLFEVDWIYHLSIYSGEKRRIISISSKKKTKKNIKSPLAFNNKVLKIYFKHGMSKYSKDRQTAFLDRTFNSYKFSLEPSLEIIIHESFYRSKKLNPICNKSQTIAEILEIKESISTFKKNKKILNINWKIDNLYETKYLQNSAEKLFFCQNKIEEFLSKLFLPNFELNFLMQESENMRQQKLFYFQTIENERKKVEDERRRKEDEYRRQKKIHDEQIKLSEIEKQIERDRLIRLNQERKRLSFAFAEIIRQKILSVDFTDKKDLLDEFKKYVEIIKEDFNPEFKNNKLIVSCPFCLKNINLSLNKENHFIQCSILSFNSLQSTNIKIGGKGIV